MPVVGCSDDDYIQPLVLQQISEILISLWSFSLDLFHIADSFLQHICIHITQGRTFGIG